MKKLFTVMFAAAGLLSGVFADDFIPPLFSDGKPIAGFNAAADGAINLNANCGQWGGALIPFVSGSGSYTVTMEILSPGGDHAGAILYFVMADRKHQAVSQVLKGGDKPKTITIKFVAQQGVKGLMLKKVDRKQQPSVAIRNVRINYISDQVEAAKDVTAGKKILFPFAERKSARPDTVAVNGKTGTALAATHGQYAWNTIFLPQEFPAGKYLLEMEAITADPNAALIGVYLGGKDSHKLIRNGYLKAGKDAVRTVKFTFTADKPFYFAIRDNTSGELLFVGRYETAK